MLRGDGGSWEGLGWSWEDLRGSYKALGGTGSSGIPNSGEPCRTIPFFMRKELRNSISVKDLEPKLDYPKNSTSQLKTAVCRDQTHGYSFCHTRMIRSSTLG